MVEAMGHINYDLSMKEDWKGINRFHTSNGSPANFTWKMYNVPLHDNKLLSWTKLGQDIMDTPVLLRARVNITESADTYLNMKYFNKGYVWVNGRNLGRFWNVGPQYKLYCPGVWLKKGENVVEVLDIKYSG